MSVLSTYIRIIKQMSAKLVNIAYIINIPSIYMVKTFVCVETRWTTTIISNSTKNSLPHREVHHVHTHQDVAVHTTIIPRSVNRPFRWKKWGESVRGIGCKSIPEEAGKVGTHSRKVWLYTLAKTNIGPLKKMMVSTRNLLLQGLISRGYVSLREGYVTTTMICIWDVQKNMKINM